MLQWSLRPPTVARHDMIPALPFFPARAARPSGGPRALIANRGEIVVRVVRARQALGIEVVAAVSEADARQLAARHACRQVVIGPPAPAQAACRSSAWWRQRCDAVHPGYGFLVRARAFAQVRLDAGWSSSVRAPAAIAVQGDKITAARLAADRRCRAPGSGAVPDAAHARPWPAASPPGAGEGQRRRRRRLRYCAVREVCRWIRPFAGASRLCAGRLRRRHAVRGEAGRARAPSRSS